MGTLVKLRLVQGKATVRNLFSKPLSAIITLLMVALYGSMFIPLVANAGKPPIAGETANNIILYIIGFGLLLEVSTLAQGKKSLFFLSDAHYLYTGPFTRYKVLAACALDLVSSALMFGLISLVPVVMGSAGASVPPGFLLTAFLAGTCAHYGLLAVNAILYVRALSAGKPARGSVGIIIALAAILAGLGVAAFAGAGFNVPAGLTALTQGPLLNWVPFFGWARMAMQGALAHSLPLLLGVLGLLVAGVVVTTLVLVRLRGDFFEQSMMDAESFTEYYQKARSGQATSEGKVRNASVRFSRREGAILSKNLLIALKGRELIRLTDFIVILVYLGMAYFIGMGFLTYCIMLTFWMFMMAGTSSLVEDLKHHYVYLLPGRALKKLLCTLAIPLAKNALVLLISLVGGSLLLGASWGNIAVAAVICLSMVVVFMAGNVLSLRLMKSRSNKMVEQTLRMLLSAVAMVPGLAVFMLLQFAAGGSAAALAAPIFAGFNLLLAGVVLLACAPMMQGNELNAD